MGGVQQHETPQSHGFSKKRDKATIYTREGKHGMEKMHWGQQQLEPLPLTSLKGREGDGQIWGESWPSRPLVGDRVTAEYSLPMTPVGQVPPEAIVKERGHMREPQGPELGVQAQRGRPPIGVSTTPRQQWILTSFPKGGVYPYSRSQVAPKSTQIPQAGTWELFRGPFPRSPLHPSAYVPGTVPSSLLHLCPQKFYEMGRARCDLPRSPV